MLNIYFPLARTVHVWNIPQALLFLIIVRSNKYNVIFKFSLDRLFHFRLEKLAVISSDGIAALSRKLLWFLPWWYLVCADTIYIMPVQRLFLSMNFFLSGIFKIFVAVDINNWVAFIIYYFFHNCMILI